VNLLSGFVILLLKVYRLLVSPAKNLVFGPSSACRFQPSCSAYSIEAIQKHGLIQGLFLTLKRILKCHPWGSSGHDPVPALHRCSH